MASILYSSALDLLDSLGRIVLSPLLSGSLLLSAIYYLDTVRHVLASVVERLPHRIATIIVGLPVVLLPTAITALRVLFALGIVSSINRGLNKATSNS